MSEKKIISVRYTPPSEPQSVELNKASSPWLNYLLLYIMFAICRESCGAGLELEKFWTWVWHFTPALLLCALQSPKVMFPVYNYVRTINSCDYLATSNSQRGVNSTTTLSLVKPPSRHRNFIKKFCTKLTWTSFFFLPARNYYFSFCTHTRYRVCPNTSRYPSGSWLYSLVYSNLNYPSIYTCVLWYMRIVNCGANRIFKL
jgi:hypothetical protein